VARAPRSQSAEKAGLEPGPASLYTLFGIVQNMSTSPTLPPVTSPSRKPTPLPAALPNESEARLQAALAASARAEASLSGLFRAIQHLGSGVGGAREANELLSAELEGLRELLGRASDQQLVFERKVLELESVLDRTRKEYDRERSFFIDQQDAFLIKLLDEQEADLQRRDADLHVLRGRIAELERRGPSTLPPPLESPPSGAGPAMQLLEPARSSDQTESELARAERDELARTAQKLAEDRERARETVARLLAQRDDAQSAVLRISKERDDALLQIHRLKSQLGGPRMPLSTRPPASDTRRDSAAARAHDAAAGPTLEQLDLEARRPERAAASSGASSHSNEGGALPISSVLSPPPNNPNAGPLPTRLSPPPSRLSPPPAARPSPPPEELERALIAPPSPPSSTASRPPFQQGSDPSSRPLGGYALGNDSVETEHLEGVPTSRSAPPGSGKR
jgi:hypothetical protein